MTRRSGRPAAIPAAAPLGPEGFAGATGVSRETLDRLRVHAGLLAKWQRAVNLVAPSTLPDLWRRHMLDSAQLAAHLPRPPGRIADMGSGAGFPGLVLAVVTGVPTTLIESDTRKCAFLREAVRLTGAPATVVNVRLGAPGARIPGADVVVARALAPLLRLCALAHPLGPRWCLFPKGGGWRRELAEARGRWTMEVEGFASLSAPSGRILRLRGLAPAGAETPA